MIRVSRFAGRAMVLLAFVLLPALAFAPDASAKTCAQVSIGGSAVGLTLTPSTATIVAGGCVTYTNNTTPLSVQVTVGKASSTAAPGNAVTFAVKTAGTYSVKVAQQPIGGSGSGTLVVKRAPVPKPSPTPTRSVPASASPSPQPTPSQSTGPQIAPTVTPTGAHPSPSTSPASPSLGPPPVTQGVTTPSPTPTTSPTVIVSQLQPASGRAVGLPAAVAALLVVGGGAAVGRVLLAEPGPGDRDGKHRR